MKKKGNPKTVAWLIKKKTKNKRIKMQNHSSRWKEKRGTIKEGKEKKRERRKGKRKERRNFPSIIFVVLSIHSWKGKYLEFKPLIFHMP